MSESDRAMEKTDLSSFGIGKEWEKELPALRVFERLPQRIFVKDTRSVFVFCTTNYARELDLNPDQIVGKDDFALRPAEQAEIYRAEDREVLSTGAARTVEEAYERSGRQRMVRTIKVPYRDEEGRIIGVLGTLDDITDEWTLRKEQRRLNAILETTSDFISMATPENKLSYLNAAGRKLLGWGAEEDIGERTIADVHAKDSSETVLKTGIPAAIRDGTWSGETTVWNRGGREIPVSQVIMSHKAPDGKVEFLSTIIRDISERIQAEAAIKRQADLFTNLITTSLDGFWLVDAEGRFLDVNDRYCAMSGYARDELLRMGVVGIEAKESAEETARHIEKLMRDGSDIFTSRHRRKDGGAMEVEISAIFWKSQGQIIASVRDITDRVNMGRQLEGYSRNLERMVELRTEELRVALEAAEAADEAKSRFLSRMSHELYTPLNAIIGFSQIMQMDTRSSLTADQEESIREILKAGDRLHDMVDRILEYSYRNSDHRKGDVEIVPCAPFLRGCIETMKAAFTRRDIEVIVDVEEGHAVMADKTGLCQAIQGLLSNAIRYNREGGKVEVSCEARSPKLTRITVSDTGRGIPAERLGRLFEVFEGIDAVSETGDGIGMGLALCKRIVEEMGGSVGAESGVGVGSRFWIELPTADAAGAKGEG